MRRHFGYRRTLALGLGVMGALVKARYLPAPSDGVPYAAILLVERVNALAVAVMGRQLCAPATTLLRRRPRTKRVLGGAWRLTVLALAVACLEPIAKLAPEDGTPPTLAYLGWSAATIASAWAPLAAFEANEWLRSRVWWRRFFLAGEGAASGTAPIGELRRRRFRPRWFDGLYGFNDGLLLGRTLVEATHAPFPIRLRDELGTILLGSARSGKSVRFFWNWAATNDQIKVFVDPKAHAMRLLTGRLSDPAARDALGGTGIDAAGITRARERLAGGVVLAFDPYGLGRPYVGGSINVVPLIDPESPYCRVLLSAVSQSVVVSSGNDTHWVTELTRLFIEGMLLHVRTARPLAQQSLGCLADLFAGMERVDGDIRLTEDFRAIDALVREMATNPAGGGVCVSAAQAFASLEGREVGIVVSEVARSFKSFTDPVIRAATSGRGYDLRAFVESRRPATLFLSMPFGALVEHARVLRVIVSFLLRLTEQRTDKSRAIHYFLDEFAAYANNLSAARDATVTLGGAGARLHVALQYIQQLSQCLGRDAADAFEASSNVVAAGVGDLATAEYLSRRFGSHTRVERTGWWPLQTETRRTETPVVDPATVMRLLDRSSRLGACVPGVGAPFLFETLAYRPLRLHGSPMEAWPLPDDAFDEHLLAAQRGDRPALALTTPRPAPTGAPTLTLTPPAPVARLRLTQRD